MKYAIALLTALILLASCKTDHLVSGEVNVAVEYSSTEIKQVNGILYIRTVQGNITLECIALDPSALYDSGWVNIIIQDANRLSSYTQEEIDNCA